MEIIQGENMRILFATDGSDISMMALENISNYVKSAIVDAICVIDWSFLPSSMNIEQENYSKTYENIADSVLNFSKTEIEKHKLESGNMIKSVGSPVEGILEQAVKEDYDLILMGSHGKKGLQKWLGSVSRQVLSNTLLPVFISRKRNKSRKVLFTVDGSEHSLNAVKQAVNLFELSGKEISIISIKENPELIPLEAAMDRNWIENIDKQQKIHAAKAINKAKSILTVAGLDVANEVILTGNPAQKIIEFVELENVDLVVMGARSKTNLSTVLLGSVSKRVLENVESSVMIVRK